MYIYYVGTPNSVVEKIYFNYIKVSLNIE